MTFDNGGSFEGGRVRKGRRGTLIAGGGIAAVLVTLLGVVLSGGKLDLATVLDAVGSQGGGQAQAGDEEWVPTCTGEEANSDRECRLSATAQALDTYWASALPTQAGVEYVKPGVVSVAGSTSTACGTASNAVGPFYCPPDQTVYVDVSFFDELRDRFGSSGGPLAEEYVTAHEFGHHIEQLTGVMDDADRSGTGPTSDSVRIELMADCLAGMWAGHAAETNVPGTNTPFLKPITDADLADALSAAAAVGDDHIQQQANGTVNPEAWTHGSSEQRQRWFRIGYDGGTFDDCNALKATRL